MELTVLGVGADPRMQRNGSYALVTDESVVQGLVLTYREQTSDDWGGLAVLLDFLELFDLAFWH